MRQDPRIQAVLEKLSTIPASKVSVRQLAESVHLSPSRFSHLFALATGFTPRKYLKHQLRNGKGYANGRHALPLVLGRAPNRPRP